MAQVFGEKWGSSAMSGVEDRLLAEEKDVSCTFLLISPDINKINMNKSQSQCHFLTGLLYSYFFRQLKVSEQYLFSMVH